MLLISILASERDRGSGPITRSHSKSEWERLILLPTSLHSPIPLLSSRPTSGIQRLMKVILSEGIRWVDGYKQIKTSIWADIRDHIIEITRSLMGPFSSCLSSTWHKPALYSRWDCWGLFPRVQVSIVIFSWNFTAYLGQVRHEKECGCG